MPNGNKEPVILVVDNEEDLARLGAQLVEMCGYRGISCSSGLEARALLRECDLVFTDLVMDGFTGMDLIEWIRADGNDIPIVATSGSPEPLSGAIAAGACAIIPKPWELDVLKRTFAELLG